MVSASPGSHVSTMGPYTLDYELSSGPLGSLWSAHVDAGPYKGALVSLRRIDAKSLASEAVDEIAAAAAWAMELKDDRLMAVTDILGDGNELGVVGTRLEGLSLRAVLRAAASNRQSIPEPVAARFALDVAEQLEVLHSFASGDARFVFGGLAPESLFFERDGWTSVIDIGVAAAAARTSEIGLHPERASYFAPEQADGRCTARTDVFTLGLMLWEMLGTRRAYGAETLEQLLDKVRSARIPDLNRLVRPGARPVSDAVSAVIARALAREPAERFASPTEFADALASAVQPATHVKVALAFGLLKPSSVKPAPPRKIPLPQGPRRQVDTLPYADDATLLPALESEEAVEPTAAAPREAFPSFDIDLDWDD